MASTMPLVALMTAQCQKQRMMTACMCSSDEMTIVIMMSAVQ
jgi:hypothetical protein